jgi:hypothetical protein
LTRSRYRLDGDDIIRWVSGGWIRFAERNTDRPWDPESVLGHSIWSYIEGHEVRNLYALLLRRVRTAGIAVDVPFRCDAPDHRRDMRLQIESLEEGDVQLTVSFPTRMPPDDEAVQDEASEVEPEARPRPGMIPVCSWCDRLLLQGMGWVNVEAAVEALELFDGRDVPSLSHGACPDCYSDVMVGAADLG